MKIAMDTSAFAKRYIEEAGSDAVEDLLQQAAVLGLCILCVPEIVSALNRRRREGSITNGQYRQIKVTLRADIADVAVLNITPPVIEATTSLLETNVLRALDALHVACAVTWGAELFVSADERQVRAAEDAGLRAAQV